MKVRFRAEAAADVLRARKWYDQQRQALGDEFVEALEQLIDLISTFPAAAGEIGAGHRRAVLRRFPYSLYYGIDQDVIDVVACLHNARSDDLWPTRLRRLEDDSTEPS